MPRIRGGFFHPSVRAFERAPHHHLLEHLYGIGHRLIEPHPHLGFVGDAAIVRREARISGDRSAGVIVESRSAKATMRRTSLASCRRFPVHL